MARKKAEKELSLKPKYRHFLPKNSSGESILLLHEEIEALWLIDYQDMYQEDAAKKMDISRPTLSRIIKKARNKVAAALIGGKEIIIQDEKNEYKIAFICDEYAQKSTLNIKGKTLVIVDIKDGKIADVKTMQNPAKDETHHIGNALLPTLYEQNINLFITNKIGEGLKNSLLNHGVFSVTKDKISLDELKIIYKTI